jgi:chemotaxis protein MotA
LESQPSGTFIDKSTVAGVLIAFALVAYAIYLGGNAKGFIDFRSFLIVVCGTVAVTIACFSFAEVMSANGSMFRTIFYRYEDIEKSATNAMQLAETARKKGVLALEGYGNLTRHNSFLREGVEMLVDHANLDELENILNNKIDSMAYRHAKSISILRKSAEVSPAMGLIGTLIGLVQMLSSMEDAATIGPAMAVALLTTFYGALLSYMFFSPMAAKLERNTRDEILVAKIYMNAVLSIAKKESPRKLELMLNSILPPIKRINYFYTKREVKQVEG